MSVAIAEEILECDPYKYSSVKLLREYSDDIVNLKPGEPINALIAFVGFEDRKAVEADRSKLTKISKKVGDFYYQMSEGGISFNWFLHPTTTQLGKSIATYNASSRGNFGSAQIIEDTQIRLRKEIDIDDLDLVLVVTPSTTLRSEVSNSIAYLNRGNGIMNSAILASDFWKSEGNWQIVAHEIGHAFGLLDLYNLETANLISEGRASYFDQFEFMKAYDLMNWPNANSPSLVLWNRFQMDSTLSSRIICFKEGVKKYRLVSINSSKPGFKGVLVPLLNSRVMMIEVRDNIGVDAKIGKSDLGVITYVVNLNTESGKGPIRVNCSNAQKSKFSNCGLKAGQSRIVEGFKVAIEKYSKAELILSIVRKY
jgi:hypothetical protein